MEVAPSVTSNNRRRPWDSKVLYTSPTTTQTCECFQYMERVGLKVRSIIT